ncbi:MAG: putative metalloendopeptidase [Caulobacter sp.]|nr:putative metalloendopeptidase [Caulobacter sp.]
MKRVLLAAAAVAALSVGAYAAASATQGSGIGRIAVDSSACLDDLCQTQALFVNDNTGGGAPTPVSLDAPRFGTWGFDLAGMDRSVNPGDNFYDFANGNWDKVTEIPSDRTRFGNFDKLTVLSEARTRAIIEEAMAGKNPSDPDAVRVGTAYASFMDEARVEQLDSKPIQPELATIRAAKTRDDLTALMGLAPTTGYSSIFNFGIQNDLKAPTKYAIYGGQGGLGLPDRDYYLDPKFAEKKTAYEAYVAKMLTLVGWPDAANEAKAVVAYETRLAEVYWSRVQLRDRDKIYNPTSLAQLKAMAPGIAWDRFLANEGFKGEDRFIVTTNTVFPKSAAIYNETPISTLKAWQAYHLTDGAAPLLSKRFVDANFEFKGKILSGQLEQKPRWKRGVGYVENAMGEAVGRVYVARYFTPEAKAKAEGLVHDIQAALKNRIEHLDWMSAETKTRALDKLSKFTIKIGYPDKWRDYAALKVTKTDLYGNAQRAGAFEWNHDLKRLHDPVDKAEWGMTPQTVNAYYNSSNNEIVFPAAILQPPFFDANADMAVNYGGIGVVIGHEISHGFDDQGRKSDGMGVLTDWWTTEDNAKFNVQRDKLSAQYSAFEPLPGMHVNGNLTMGENIGDMGGVSLALDAYHVYLNGQPAPVLDGFTGDQRVFLGFAQVWRDKIRDDALKLRLTTDPHSPARVRVNATIRNVDGWYAAWGIKPGDKLYVAPTDRVRIW